MDSFERQNPQPVPPYSQHWVGPPVLAELVHVDRLPPLEPEEPPRRSLRLPLILFAATCLSTFWAGMTQATNANFAVAATDSSALATIVAEGWRHGLVYMLAVMAILFSHEMGHFLQAVRYRVPASLPFFIPMPLTPIGTMGAVIGLQGSQANRRELFDIGLSGPLAGLAVALPITWLGIQLEPWADGSSQGHMGMGVPLLMQWMFQWLRPEELHGMHVQLISPLNPWLMAGWVGMLITGLNMMPVSQLDGGHVAYALFGRKAHILARAVVFAAMGYMLITGQYSWMVMLILVMVIGTDHPPTRDDRVPIGWGRRILGYASLSLSVLCLTPTPFY